MPIRQILPRPRDRSAHCWTRLPLALQGVPRVATRVSTPRRRTPAQTSRHHAPFRLEIDLPCAVDPAFSGVLAHPTQRRQPLALFLIVSASRAVSAREPSREAEPRPAERSAGPESNEGSRKSLGSSRRCRRCSWSLQGTSRRSPGRQRRRTSAALRLAQQAVRYGIARWFSGLRRPRLAISFWTPPMDLRKVDSGPPI